MNEIIFAFTEIGGEWGYLHVCDWHYNDYRK